MTRKAIDIETFNGERFEHSGRVVLEDDGVVRFEGMNERSVREYFDYGVVGLGRNGILYPKDGAAFLDALREQCGRCSMVRAVVREEK